MECRNVVIGGHPIMIRLHRTIGGTDAWIAASLEHHDALTAFRKPRRERTATGARTDDDVVAFGRLTTVFTDVFLVIFVIFVIRS